MYIIMCVLCWGSVAVKRENESIKPERSGLCLGGGNEHERQIAVEQQFFFCLRR